MKFYIFRSKNNINAIADYDPTTKSFTVLKGSKVSDSISQSKTFRSAKSIEKMRQGNIDDNYIMTSKSTFSGMVSFPSTFSRNSICSGECGYFFCVLGDILQNPSALIPLMFANSM